MKAPKDICPIVSANIHVAKTLITNDLLADLPGHLEKKIRSMVSVMEDNAHSWPHDKTGRWLGFIQGILFSHGVMDVNDERDRTRTIFHKAYQESGLSIPDSVDVEKGVGKSNDCLASLTEEQIALATARGVKKVMIPLGDSLPPITTKDQDTEIARHVNRAKKVFRDTMKKKLE